MDKTISPLRNTSPSEYPIPSNDTEIPPGDLSQDLPRENVPISDGKTRENVPISDGKARENVPISDGKARENLQFNGSTNQTVPTACSGGARENDSDTVFVNVDDIGKRRSNHLPKPSSKIINASTIGKCDKAKLNSLKKSMFPKSVFYLFSFIAMMTSTFSTTTAHCYQSHQIAYNDYLESNFDGTVNSISPFAQIYAATKSANEVYTLKEMLKQSDKNDFIEAMKKDVKNV